jgi:CelD/BcsL family acetyltransferase involved in cellulose biosynthesis
MLAPRDTALTTEWRPLASLAGVAAEWRALGERAAEPNVFYAPDFALPAAAALAPDAGAVLVRAVEPHRLIGFFPCRIEARRYGLRLPLLTGFTHPYGPLGTPLVDRGAVDAAVGAFLDHVADDVALPKLLLMPYLVEGGPVAAALAAGIAQRDGREARFGRHRRALLAPGDDRDDYLSAALGRKKRKELGRQRRRLAEAGEIAFTLGREPSAVANGLAHFFALEAHGWKGRARTAAALSAAIRQFMETAVMGLAAHGQARVVRLVHADRTIAAGIVLTSGSGAWFWKIAHDEGAARASPGVQLTRDLTEALLRDPAVAWCDSCATADHAMIDSIWRERRPMADLLCGLEPGLDFAVACRLEALRRGAISAARKVRAVMTRR